MTVLKAVRITKKYGRGRLEVSALRDVSLNVATGEAVALMGPSGSGKSTLLAVLGLLTPATSGRLRVAGQEVPPDERTRARFRNEFFGYVHQEYAIIDDESVAANVAIPLDYARPRVPRARAQERVRTALAEVKLGWAVSKRAADLSGGERQRVAIARALVNRPKVLLADEPTAALDTSTAEGIVTLLLSLRERDTAVLVATHDPRVADRCDRIVQIEDGRIVEPSVAEASVAEQTGAEKGVAEKG